VNNWVEEWRKVMRDYKRETGRNMISKKELAGRLNLKRTEFNSQLITITFLLPIYESDTGYYVGLLGGKR